MAAIRKKVGVLTAVGDCEGVDECWNSTVGGKWVQYRFCVLEILKYSLVNGVGNNYYGGGPGEY